MKIYEFKKSWTSSKTTRILAPVAATQMTTKLGLSSTMTKKKEPCLEQSADQGRVGLLGLTAEKTQM